MTADATNPAVAWADAAMQRRQSPAPGFKE